MRRFFIAALCVCTAVAAGAQNITDALQYSENNYYGTARSLALGNAMTALGGDLGSIGINPAGAAVSRYSQFTISPGVTLMTNSSDYSVRNDEDYANLYKTSNSLSTLPNIGLNFQFDTGKRHGLKSYSLGFIVNTTNRYTNESVGRGTNPYTTQLGSFAYFAGSYYPDELASFSNYSDSSIPWNSLLAYQSGMIGEALSDEGEYLFDEEGYLKYAGATEQIIKDGDSYYTQLAGPVDQYSDVCVTGSKQDIVLNAAFNYDDRFYLGFNLGLPVGSYRYNEYFRETAVDPTQFELIYDDGTVTNFKNSSYELDQRTEISGIYAKVGMIFLPFPGLRLGAAIQTPTRFTLTEKFELNGAVNCSNPAYSSGDWSPRDEYTYCLRTPWRFNVGAAATISDFALLSADLEMTDYSTMRFYTGDGDANFYYAENTDIQDFCGKQLEARFGAEVKVLPDVAVRAGYTIKNRGEYEAGKALEGKISSYSLGFGYSSSGSFFADFAFRRTNYPVSYFSPYADYLGGYLPEVRSRHSLSDIVATVGWRF